MDYFITQTINGLGIGSLYALVAIGYTMVYGIVKLINFAHGDLIMVGAYMMVLCINYLKLPFGIAILVSMALTALIGVILEKLAYKPLREAPRIYALITAIAVSIFLQNIFNLIYGPDPRSFKTNLSGTFKLGNISVSINTIITIFVSIILMILLTIFIKYTKVGKSMRAVSEDAGAASLMGINVNNTITITFAIGSSLAAIAGALYSISYPSITPTMGSMFGIKAFIAAVLGGIGIVPGAMLGGFLLGICEAYSKGYISAAYSDTIVFSILILTLILKPDGILGKNIKEKV